MTVTCTKCGHKGMATVACKLALPDVQRDMAFGQPRMINTDPDADMKANKDCVIGSLGIAYRTRRVKVGKYNEVSIRNSRKNGAKTEKQKILDGECQAQVFIWEFLDAWVLSTFSHVLDALQTNQGYEQDNNDGATSAYYINLADIEHILISKDPHHD